MSEFLAHCGAKEKFVNEIFAQPERFFVARPDETRDSSQAIASAREAERAKLFEYEVLETASGVGQHVGAAGAMGERL